MLAKRVPSPSDRYAAIIAPAAVHDWTLLDAGPYMLRGVDKLQVRIACKCGHRRYIARSAWYAGKIDTKRCRRCFKRGSKGLAQYTPYRAAIMPHWER